MKIEHVAWQVADPVAAADWYVAHLGMRIVRDGGAPANVRFLADETGRVLLEGKDVFLMFDVSEAADRLLAGYTIFEPHARSWPPHNHTDQEEIYLFTKGRGAIEVYADEKSKTFVYSMDTLDAATIPVLNYHPVFSQDEELHFIWCLAGERYWVGDKHKEFMNASVDELTT